jgi:hypothetical protein
VVEVCKWEADAGVKAVKLECEKSLIRYVATRNMDANRGKYAWRVSRFDMESGAPHGHSYGKDLPDALNEGTSKWEKCKVVAVRTESGQGDFGRARFEKLTTTLNSSVPTREARRVVAAFLRGETARGACTGKGEARKCAIVSRKNTLEVSGEIVASRDGRTLSVCVPPKATMAQRGKRQHETEAAKDVRVAASTLLRRVAGIAVRSDAEGQRLLAAGGRAALLMPGACVQVRIPKKQVARLMAAARVSEEAEARYNTEFPTQDQRAKAIRVLRAKQRNEALTKAQDKRRMRVGPASVPFPEEEYAPETISPEPPLPEYAPVEYESPSEDETFDFEPTEVPAQTARILPTDVPNPTDPEILQRFETEVVARLRSPKRKAAAEAWVAYLLNPEGRTPRQAIKLEDGEKDVVREMENILANEYGIVDPLYGYTPSEWLRVGPRAGSSGKRRGPVDPIQAEKMRRVRTERTGYKQRQAQKAEAAREMRYLRKGIKAPKIRNLKNT